MKYEWDFGIELRVESENPSNFFIEAPLQTQDLIPDEILKRRFEGAFNKEVRSFHIPPEKNIDSYIGEVRKVWWDEPTNKPWVRLEIFSDSPWALEVQGMLVEDMVKPYEKRRIKGVSAGVVEYRNKKTGKLVDIRIREVSIAENPACKICTTKMIVLNDKGGNIKMSEKNESQIDVNALIKTHDDRIAEKDTKISEFSETIKIHLNTIKTQKDKIVGLEAEIVEYEEIKEELEKMKLEKATFPIRSQILEYEKIDPKNELFAQKMEELNLIPEDTLKTMLAHFERAYKIDKKGLGEEDEKTKPIISSDVKNFDGKISDLKGDEHVKAVDAQVEATSPDRTKGTGGY